MFIISAFVGFIADIARSVAGFMLTLPQHSLQKFGMKIMGHII